MSVTPLPLARQGLAEPDADACGAAADGAGRLVVGPSGLIGAVAHLLLDGRAPACASDLRRIAVDVAIPLRRDQASIVYCLAGLHGQTRRVRRIALVDDGSGERDGTVVLAREFAAANGLRIDVLTVPRAWQGDGVALAAAFDGDALLVLDGRTVLESPDYIEQCLQALQHAGVAGACGAALPLRDEDRRAWARTDAFRRWVGRDDYRDPCAPRNDPQRIGRWLGDTYRESVGLVQQRVLHRGRPRALDGIVPPPGAVLYRRDCLAALPAASGAAGPMDARLGLGFALARAGYRAVQRPGVVARTQPRALSGLPRRRARHACALLGRARRFGALLQAPLWPVAADAPRAGAPGRGTGMPRRPAGWVLAAVAAEMLALPVLGLGLLAVGGWRWLAGVFAIELVLWLLALALVAPARPLATLAKGLVVAPLRYVEIAADAVGALRFLLERRR